MSDKPDNGSKPDAQPSLPPQSRILFSAAGGGFGGALLALIVGRILEGPCCCNGPTAAAADFDDNQAVRSNDTELAAD